MLANRCAFSLLACAIPLQYYTCIMAQPQAIIEHQPPATSRHVLYQSQNPQRHRDTTNARCPVFVNMTHGRFIRQSGSAETMVQPGHGHGHGHKDGTADYGTTVLRHYGTTALRFTLVQFGIGKEMRCAIFQK